MRTEITAQTKLDILDAFLDVAKTKEVKKITIKDITQKAGYNRSTFYRYFTNIYDIQDYAYQYIKPKLNFTPKATIRKPINISMQQMVDNGKKILQDNLDIMKRARTPETRRRFEDEFIRTVSASLLKSTERLDEKTKEYYKLLIGYHVRGAAHLFLDYANNAYRLSIDEFSKLFAEMHIHGVFTMMNRLKTQKSES